MVEIEWLIAGIDPNAWHPVNLVASPDILLPIRPGQIDAAKGNQEPPPMPSIPPPTQVAPSAEHLRQIAVARQMNATSDEALVRVLAQQWACPVYPLDRHPRVVSWNDVAPFTLFASARAVPAHISLDGRTLHVAFSERVDHTLLYALERMLDCRTIPCVASESAVNAILEAKSLAADRNDINFDTLRDAGGIASAICSYAQQIEASQAKLERAGPHLWARLNRGREFRDLLFRVLSPTNPNLERSPKAPKEFSNSADIAEEGVAGQPLPQ